LSTGYGVGYYKKPTKRASGPDQADRIWRHPAGKIDGKTYPEGNRGEWRASMGPVTKSLRPKPAAIRKAGRDAVWSEPQTKKPKKSTPGVFAGKMGVRWGAKFP
jgi:hypothetical protein